MCTGFNFRRVMGGNTVAISSKAIWIRRVEFWYFGKWVKVIALGWSEIWLWPQRLLHSSWSDTIATRACHDDVIKWKHFQRYWPFVREIDRSPVNSPHKGQWRGALIFFTCDWLNCWVNNREAGDLGRHRAHYDITVILCRSGTR